MSKLIKTFFEKIRMLPPHSSGSSESLDMAALSVFRLLPGTLPSVKLADFAAIFWLGKAVSRRGEGAVLEGLPELLQGSPLWQYGIPELCCHNGRPSVDHPLAWHLALSLTVLPAAERVLASFAASLGGRCRILGEMPLFSRDALAAFAGDLATPFLAH
jgi:hypothetical protein